MSERVYHRHREEAFNSCPEHPNKKEDNCHHIFERNDKKRKLLPPNFPVDSRQNLIPLPIGYHNLLHEIMDNTKEFKRNVATRVYLANMAFNGELDLIPDRLYLSDPKDMMRSKR